MAKHNLSRYNLAKYNRSADGSVIYDKLQIGALWMAQIGLGQKTKDALRIDAAFTGTAKGASGSLERIQMDAVVTQDATGRYIAYGHDTLSATFNEDIHMAAVVKDTTTWAAAVTQKSCLSPKVRDLGIQMDAELNCDTYLGCILRDIDPIMAYGIFSAVVSAEALEEISMDLSVTIKPGDILVIDSDNFRVLLNGENAIKYHSGSWIDELNRNSKSITISGGGDALESSIYYQELWL